MLPLRKRTGLLVASIALALFAARPVHARYNQAIAVLPDGNTMITGGMSGFGGGTSYLNSVLIWSSTVPWTSLNGPNMAVARASHTMTVLPDGRVLVVGGRNAGGALNTAEIYNPTSNAWSGTIALNETTGRFNHTATLLHDGRVLIAGGHGTGGVLRTSEYFDFQTDSFSAGPTFKITLGRAGHTATLVQDGRVWVAGGYTNASQSNFAQSTEMFDPATGVWAPSRSLIQARAFHTATQMGNLHVLVAGGYNGGDASAAIQWNIGESMGILPTSEIYDPVADTIVPGPAMSCRRMLHSAALTPEGRVRIFGGLGNITTSYITEAAIFKGSGTVVVTSNGFPDSTIAAGTLLTVEIAQFQLGSQVAGVVINGRILYTSATATLENADIDFTFTGDPSTELRSEMGGTKIYSNKNLSGSSLVDTSTFAIANPGGKVIFKPIEDAAIEGADIGAGQTVAFSGGQMTAPDQTRPLTGAGPSIPVVVKGFPRTSIGGAVIDGRMTLTGGAIEQEGTDSQVGFSIEITGGTLDLDAASCQIVKDPDAEEAGMMTCPSAVPIASIAGTITCSSCGAAPDATPISSPVSLAGLEITGFTGDVEAITSPLSITDISVSYEVGTVTIKHMIMGHREDYFPNTNTFGADNWPSSSIDAWRESRLNLPALLLNNGDQSAFLGQQCGLSDCSTLSDSSLFYFVYSLKGVEGHGEYVWSAGPEMSGVRSNHTTTVLPDGKVLVAGGEDGVVVLDSAEVFDTANSSWGAVGGLHQARSHHTATLLPNGTVLVAGGFRSLASTGATNTSEIYNPASGRWSRTEPMVSSRAYHTATLLPDGNVLVAGGYDGTDYLDTAEIYFSTARHWVRVQDMNRQRGQHTATLLYNGKVLLAGGFNVDGVTTDCDLYDPTNTPQTVWNDACGAMNYGRHSHTATLLRGGMVMAVGGTDGFWEIGRAEFYDPVANNWTVVSQNFGSFSKDIDVATPRLNHSATVLPDGSVLISGGFTTLGGSVKDNESFRVESSSFSPDGVFQEGRGNHGAVVLHDGRVLITGGEQKPGYLKSTAIEYYGATPDLFSPEPSRRRPEIVSVDTHTFQRGERLTVIGDHFQSVGEAGAGGSGPSSSDHDQPRLYLQRLDNSGNSSGNADGFLVDFSTLIVTQEINSWSNMGSSITVVIPDAAGLVPYGWYLVRVGANGQFSEGIPVLAGPHKPSGVTGTPSGTSLGISSISWSWAAADPSGSPYDGYNVYSATNSVFLATVAANGFPATVSWIQTDLGPDTSAQIIVAPYNLSGDGDLRFSTVPINTPSSELSNLTGAAISTNSILWSWSDNPAATIYEIYQASTGFIAGTSLTNNFTQTGLSTNTAYGVRVRAQTGAGPGSLLGPTTVFTMAAAPEPAVPTMRSVSTGSFAAYWKAGNNPSGTLFELRYWTQFDATEVKVTSITDVQWGLDSAEPNTRYYAKVYGVNGDDVLSSEFTSLGSTVTLANTPKNPSITSIDLNSIGVAWEANGNSTATIYRIMLSTVADINVIASTPVAFADNYTDVSATITESVVTGKNYTFYISARDQFGRDSGVVSTGAFVDNGGCASDGCVAVAVPSDQLVFRTGTLALDATRRFSLRIMPHTFPGDTTIYISTQAPNAACGGLDAGISITADPPFQPEKPLFVGISYSGITPGALSTLGMIRWDPGSSTCVHLDADVDQAQQMVTAQVNHFSAFHLAQITPAGDIADTIVYPNPLYTATQGYFTFDRLPSDARVRVYTIHGEEVFDGQANPSGLLTWRAENKTGRPVASGLYLAVIQSKDSKKIMKLAVIR